MGKKILFLIMLVTICFAMMVSVSANDNVSLNNNLTGADQDVLENIDIDIKSGSPDDSNNGVASNVSSSSANKDKSTIDYLNKNKEKFYYTGYYYIKNGKPLLT